MAGLQQVFPRFLRRRLRRPYYRLAYLLSDLRTPRQQARPAKSAVFVGEGDFDEVGNRFCDHFRSLGGLRPTDHVLDIGCGIGRMAVPLTRYLDGGSYEGFDIVKHGIAWCNKRIAAFHPNFHFTLVDLHNRVYNPRGKLSAATFRFPYPDASFDFAFATSVFTHMTPTDFGHYVDEIARVLRPGGTFFGTFFLLNDGSLRSIADGDAALALRHRGDGYRMLDAREPEAAVGLYEDHVRELFERAGFEILKPIHFGSWSGNAGAVDYQDIVVARPVCG